MKAKIERDYYLERLRKVEGNGHITIIIGVRRCGSRRLEGGFPSQGVSRRALTGNAAILAALGKAKDP